VEISVAADPLYQHLLLTAEKKFRRCVQYGDTPLLFEGRGRNIAAVRSAVAAVLEFAPLDFARLHLHAPPISSGIPDGFIDSRISHCSGDYELTNVPVSGN